VRVGLNATCFNDRPSGAKQRFAGIYGSLIAARPDIEFVVYEPSDCRVAGWFGGAANVTARRTPVPSAGRVRKLLAGAGYWSAQLKRDRLDLFEAFHLPPVRAPDCPTILTVHDARPVLADVPLLKRLTYGRVLRSALAGADHIVTVSHTMRDELLAIESGTPVSVIYNGIDPAVFRVSTSARAETTREKLGLPERFLLAVGHLEARKNYARLIEAMAMLTEAEASVSLVIVGNDGGEGAAIAEQVKRLGLAGRVQLHQGVSDAALVDIYSLCELVIFPSYYEGFGIPVLEAMAARRPLVLSDTQVFRELTEGQGAYFPWDDSRAMASSIREMLSNPERRQATISYGEQRLKAFGFDRLAAQVEQVYASVMAARSRGAF
jgi:glycosyltransferase involved in cell wall biosynthesis